MITVEMGYLTRPRRKPDAGRCAEVGVTCKDLSIAQLFLNHRIPLLRK